MHANTNERVVGGLAWPSDSAPRSARNSRPALASDLRLVRTGSDARGPQIRIQLTFAEFWTADRKWLIETLFCCLAARLSLCTCPWSSLVLINFPFGRRQGWYQICRWGAKGELDEVISGLISPAIGSVRIVRWLSWQRPARAEKGRATVQPDRLLASRCRMVQLQNVQTTAR